MESGGGTKRDEREEVDERTQVEGYARWKKEEGQVRMDEYYGRDGDIKGISESGETSGGRGGEEISMSGGK